MREGGFSRRRSQMVMILILVWYDIPKVVAFLDSWH